MDQLQTQVLSSSESGVKVGVQNEPYVQALLQ